MSSALLTAGGEWIDDAKIALPPLARFLEAPAPQGVRLAPTDDPAALRPHLARLARIEIGFPKFTDGRGYSSAALLRRDGYRGDLRAVGDVLVDQLFFLRRVGFTSFQLRADQDPAQALRALRAFSDAYQGAHDQPLPAYRRLARPRASVPPLVVAL